MAGENEERLIQLSAAELELKIRNVMVERLERMAKWVGFTSVGALLSALLGGFAIVWLHVDKEVPSAVEAKVSKYFDSEAIGQVKKAIGTTLDGQFKVMLSDASSVRASVDEVISESTKLKNKLEDSKKNLNTLQAGYESMQGQLDKMSPVVARLLQDPTKLETLERIANEGSTTAELASADTRLKDLEARLASLEVSLRALRASVLWDEVTTRGNFDPSCEYRYIFPGDGRTDNQTPANSVVYPTWVNREYVKTSLQGGSNQISFESPAVVDADNQRLPVTLQRRCGLSASAQ